MIDRLKQNLQRVRTQIADSASRSGRTADQITLVGVTKYVDSSLTGALFEAGCQSLGESRPQLLWDKAAALADLDIEWHMIGHLQRNKAKRTVESCHLIHSVDSQRLVSTLDAIGRDRNQPVQVLLEVNISGESAKHGFLPDEIEPALIAVGDCPFVHVHGLMAMAGLEGNRDDARREFNQLRELRDRLAEQGTPDNVQLSELSMGMSGDYDLAIEAGATLVRVGSQLFEGLR